MKKQEVFVGIDVSKDTLDVHLLEDGRSLSVENSPAGIEQLAQKLSAGSPTQVVMEATGGLERRGLRPLIPDGAALVDKFTRRCCGVPPVAYSG